MISDTNAHSISESFTGLFETGSKMSHACKPNLCYEFQNGFLEVCQIRIVKAIVVIKFVYFLKQRKFVV